MKKVGLVQSVSALAIGVILLAGIGCTRDAGKILLRSCAALFSVLNGEVPEGLPPALGRWCARIGW